MKIVAFAPLLLLGAAMAAIEGLPFDNDRSSSFKYQNWDDAIELARNKSGTPGLSVAVLHRGKVIYAKGFGKRNENGDPVTAETVMPIASMTKAMTASMIGELVAEGKLDWDKTPVSEYVPEAKFGPVLISELTLSDYLSHRTGLPYEDIPWLYTNETRAQVFRRLKHLNLPDKLSTKVRYSNIGYTIAGEAAANVAKVPYERLVQEKIFLPLGLTHTGFSQTEMGKYRNHAKPFYADSFQDAQAGKFHQGYLENEADGFIAAAGDAHSNAFDLLKWGSAIMHYGELDGKQILNRASVQEVLTAHTIFRAKKSIPELSPATNYGMGWFMDSYKGQTIYHHGGNLFGFSSMIMLFPDSDLVITVLSNIYVATLRDTIPFYLADEILDLPRTKDWLGKETMDVQKIYFKMTADAAAGVDLTPRLKNRPAAHPLSDYEGVYTHPLFAGDVKITLETEENADGLKKPQLHFQLNAFSSKVEHYHYETFTFIFDMWSSKQKQAATFITGQDGQVEGLQVVFNWMYSKETWTFKKQDARETVPLSTLLMDIDTKTLTTSHHCDDQEEVDIQVQDEQRDEQSVFGQDQVQFKLF